MLTNRTSARSVIFAARRPHLRSRAGHYDEPVSTTAVPEVQTAVCDVQPLRRTRRDAVRIGWLVAAYVAIRVLGLWVLHSALTADRPDGGFGTPDPPTLYEKLGAWDGGWYVKIADAGYPDHLSLATARDDSTASLVFPPLYPMAMRLLHLLGIPSLTAGLVVTAIAGIAAVVGGYAVARDLVSPRAAMLTALLWAAGPMTIVLSMVYSEALFVALAAWSLWLARRGWWLTAGGLALLSGLTRSTGIAVGVALAVAAVLALRSRRDLAGGVRAQKRGLMPSREHQALSAPGDPEPGDPEPGEQHARSGDAGPAPRRWRPVIGAALGLVGVPLWWLYVAVVSGRVDGWFAAQDLFWGSRFDFGASMLDIAWRTLTFAGDFEPMTQFVYTASTLAMLGALALLAVLVTHAIAAPARREWWPLAAYAVVLVALAVGSDGFVQSKIRFLVPMFALLLLPARRLAGAGRTARVGTIAVVVIAGAWFGAYLLTVWPYAI